MRPSAARSFGALRLLSMTALLVCRNFKLQFVLYRKNCPGVQAHTRASVLFFCGFFGRLRLIAIDKGHELLAGDGLLGQQILADLIQQCPVF